MAIRRRDLFGLGSAAGALGLLVDLAWPGAKRTAARYSNAAPLPLLDIDCASDSSAAATAYARKFAPPGYVAAGSRDAFHTPPPWTPRTTEVRQFDLSVIETTLEVADGQTVTAWAYGGTVPGPLVRATVGDRLNVVLGNHGDCAHSVHFHGAHDVSQDGLGRVAKGESHTYEFEAGPVGLHPYHCHVPPYARHIGKGMHGVMIVDPPEARPAAHEFVLSLCGFDVDGDGRNDVYTWNGMAGYYERFPLKVPVGDLVRIYLINMVEPDPIASFHLHAQTFDVYRSGTSPSPHEHTDIVSLGPAERAILEFRLPRRGRYMFHPHQSHMAERGAMGWIVAI
jgi:FtsP/CotA-like multicopper oxidase with cupredoxin domain